MGPVRLTAATAYRHRPTVLHVPGTAVISPMAEHILDRWMSSISVGAAVAISLLDMAGKLHS